VRRWIPALDGSVCGIARSASLRTLVGRPLSGKLDDGLEGRLLAYSVEKLDLG